MNMKSPTTLPLAKTAILVLAEVKAAIEAFDRGDANALDAMDAVIFAVESYHAVLQPRRDAASRAAVTTARAGSAAALISPWPARVVPVGG